MSPSTTRKRRSTITILLTTLALIGVMSGSVVLLTRTTPPTCVLPIEYYWTLHLAFSPDGTQLLSAEPWEDRIRLWNLQKGTLIRAFPATTPLAFAPDNTVVLMGTEGSILRQGETEEETLPLIGYYQSTDTSGTAYSPDGRWIAGSDSGSTTRLYDAKTGRKVHELAEHDRWVSAVAFSPDSRVLASGDWFHIHLWEVATGKRLLALPTGKLPIQFIEFAPDGLTLIGGGTWGPIHAWEVRTSNPVGGFSAPPGGARDAVFTPDGKYILMLQKHRILLLQAATGKRVSTLVGDIWQDYLPRWIWRLIPVLKPPPPLSIYSMALSPDGKRLAYAVDKEVRVIPCNFR